MRMYSEDPKVHKKTQVSLVQVLTVLAAILVTFVLPAELFTYYQQNQQGTPYTTAVVAHTSSSASTVTGQVAGTNTQAASDIISIPGTSFSINLNSQTGILIIAGALLVALGLILMIYLLLSKD